jgi:hypothetical protein
MGNSCFSVAYLSSETTEYISMKFNVKGATSIAVGINNFGSNWPTAGLMLRDKQSEPSSSEFLNGR